MAKRKRRSRKKFYAVPCMIAILALALLVTGGGHFLRRTVLAELPQYNDAPDIAIPMMLLQDSGPLREARERAAWEAAQEAETTLAQAEAAAPAEPAAQTVEAAVEPAEPVAEAQPAEQAAPTEQAAPAEQAQPEELTQPAAQAAEVPATPETAEAAPAVEAPQPEPDPTAPVPEAIAVSAETDSGNMPEELPSWLDETAATATAAPSASVGEDYFDHTLFIGDSKTDGMRMWARIGKAHYFCGTNYSVYNIFDKSSSDEEFKDVKLDYVLSHYKYDQIYILLGYNECGYPYSSLMKQFKYVIQRVHEAQPQARVILHGSMHASERVARKYDYYTVQNIETVNDGLREMAAAYDGLYYVDCNDAFCDENGFLYSHMSSDGEHLSPEYTRQWAQEIVKRAIVE